MNFDEHTMPRVLAYLTGEEPLDLSSSVVFVVLLVSISLSELFLLFGFVEYTLWGYLVTLLVAIMAPMWFETKTPLFAAIALVPLFRLVVLGMPVFVKLTLFWLLLIYGSLLPAMFFVIRARGIELAVRSKTEENPGLRDTQVVEITIGWKSAALWFPLAVIVSLVLAEIEYAIITPEALIPVWNGAQLALISGVMIGLVGFVEEFLFRGVLQRVFEYYLGTWPGLLLASGIFGLVHSGYGIPVEMLFAGGIGLLFGWIYDRTDSLLLVTIMHGVLNVFLFAVIPIHGSVFQLPTI